MVIGLELFLPIFLLHFFLPLLASLYLLSFPTPSSLVRPGSAEFSYVIFFFPLIRLIRPCLLRRSLSSIWASFHPPPPPWFHACRLPPFFFFEGLAKPAAIPFIKSSHDHQEVLFPDGHRSCPLFSLPGALFLRTSMFCDLKGSSLQSIN